MVLGGIHSDGHRGRDQAILIALKSICPRMAGSAKERQGENKKLTANGHQTLELEAFFAGLFKNG
jgi:hypothetical protein